MGPSQVIIARCRGRKPQSGGCTNETQMGHLCSGVQQTMANPTLPSVYVLPRAESLLPATGAVNTPQPFSPLCFCTDSLPGECCNFAHPQEVVRAGGVLAGGGPFRNSSESQGSWAGLWGGGGGVTGSFSFHLLSRLGSEPDQDLPSFSSVSGPGVRTHLEPGPRELT